MTVTSYPLHKIKAVLLEGVHPDAAGLLEKEGFTVETHKGSLSTRDLIEVAGDAHILGIRSKTRVNAEYLAEARRLWTVGCFCIGTNQVDLNAAADRGVVVFNAPFANTRSVAELTLAEVIALYRRLAERSMGMHQGHWKKSAAGAHEVRGRCLGIVGYGRIGSQVSVLAEMLGLSVIYYDIVDRLPLGNARPLPSLEAVLATADVVTLHVPETPETRGMIGAAQLARMKRGAHLINNSRGSVVDLDALAAAIKEGQIGGAAVDVYPKEPETNDSPFETVLAGLPNVILTPHIGGSTQEAQANIALEVSTKLIKFMNNGSTTTAVNFPEVELPQLHSDHHRILHYHRNVPGVLSQMHRVISELGVNVAAEHLQSNPRYSYVILDYASQEDAAVKKGLKQIPETIRVRTLW